MQKKLTRKEKIALQQQAGASASVRKQNPTPGSRFSLKFWLGCLVGLLAFLLYANTLHHHYVLDDNGLIDDNTITRKGIHGLKEIFTTGYRAGFMIDNQIYRPLPKAMFAMEWQIAPGYAPLSHWINVILYVFSCVLLFHVLHLYFRKNILVPFITALVFAAHPIHTEVIANIKSRDEILSLFFILLTALWSYRYLAKRNVIYAILSALALFLAMLSKESAITWIAVTPLLLYFFTGAKRNDYLVLTGSQLLAALVFILIRHQVLGNYPSPIPLMDNYLVGIKDFITQKTTAIFLMGIYLKLFVFPHPLCSDASYNQLPEVGPADWRFLVPFVILVALGVFAILRFRKKDPASFGILFFFVTAALASNLVILIGTNYGERLMYIPSIAFCFCLALLLTNVFKVPEAEQQKISMKEFLSRTSKPVGITLIIIALFSIKTIARNADWIDNNTLFHTDVQTSPNSAHMRLYLANLLTNDDELAALPDSASRRQRLLEGIGHLDKSIGILNTQADLWQARGHIYYKMLNFEKAEPDFKKSLELNNTNFITQNDYGNMLFKAKRFPEALEHYKTAVYYNPRYALGYNNMASVYGIYGMYEQQQSLTDPANKELHLEEAKRNFDLAIDNFLMAIQLDPAYPDPYNLLAVTYHNIGDEAQAARYAQLAAEVKNAEDKRKHVQN